MNAHDMFCHHLVKKTLIKKKYVSLYWSPRQKEANKALNDHGYLALVIKIFSYKKKENPKIYSTFTDLG